MPQLAIPILSFICLLPIHQVDPPAESALGASCDEVVLVSKAEDIAQAVALCDESILLVNEMTKVISCINSSQDAQVNKEKLESFKVHRLELNAKMAAISLKISKTDREKLRDQFEERRHHALSELLLQSSRLLENDFYGSKTLMDAMQAG